MFAKMAQRTNTRRAVRAVCFAAAAAALSSVAAPLFTGGFLADGAQSRAPAPARAALRSRFQAGGFQAQFEGEPAGIASFVSSFRAFGCAAVLAVAVLAQGGVANAQEREGIPSGNAKGDPNLAFSSLLPNPGGKSLLSELNDPTFGKVTYTESPADKNFKTRKAGKATMNEVLNGGLATLPK
ncbi:unnamed protein product [Polarella glacialis]|uniref:Uncharacterized protein n=1 Tax=Polarella glacialis TaxID=89957 RepID=A0A813DC94_POLGL|nr:unnamed protein product [Polarella glacialis]